jgi:hypothetical protein
VTAALVLTLFLAVAGCGKLKKKEPATFEPGQKWLQDMRTHINKVITDTDRKSQLLGVVDQFEQEMEDMDLAVQRYNKKIFAVDSDYNSTAEDFRNVFNDFHQEKILFQKRFLDLRFKMVDLTTPEEWKKLADISSEDTLFLNWQRKLEVE